MPSINRRKALALTGSGLAAALATIAASAVPAPAAGLLEHPWAKARRLAKELALTLNDMDDGAWDALVMPSNKTASPVWFRQNVSNGTAKSERDIPASPIMALFRQWDARYQGDYKTAEDDDVVTRVCREMHVLERQISALPAASEQDFAAKVIALTTFGEYGLDEHAESVFADAIRMVKVVPRNRQCGRVCRCPDRAGSRRSM